MLYSTFTFSADPLASVHRRFTYLEICLQSIKSCNPNLARAKFAIIDVKMLGANNSMI